MDRPRARLLLIDDHPASREPLAMLLEREPDFTVVGQAGSVAGARREIARGIRADLAIVDLDLGDGSGVEVIRELRRTNPEAQVIVLTGITDVREHGRAVQEGAAGIVSKTASTGELLRAIRTVLGGSPLMTPAEALALVNRAVSRQRREESEARALEGLSPREREVLKALTLGLGNEAIGDRMSVSTETVRSHIVRILNKLGAESRLQAAIIAIRHGLQPAADGERETLH